MFSSRQKFIDLVHNWRMSKTDVAGLAGVVSARVSDYCQDKSLTPDTASQIENAISQIVEVYEVFYPFRIEASDPEIFRSAVVHAKLAKASQEANSAVQELARASA